MQVPALIQGGGGGCVTPIDSIVTAWTADQNFDQLIFGIWPLTTLIFGALIIDHAEFQPLTVDYVHIYGSIRKKAKQLHPFLSIWSQAAQS